MHKRILIATVACVILGILAIAIFTMIRIERSTKINSYEACASAGNPIQESYPSVCRTSDGRSFINPDQQAPVLPQDE